MFRLKIFLRVQTFRRVPPVLPCNFCHPGLSFAFVGSLAEGIVSGKITAAENHEQEKGHRRGQIRGELDESQVSVFFSSYFEPRNPIFGVSLFLGWGGGGANAPMRLTVTAFKQFWSENSRSYPLGIISMNLISSNVWSQKFHLLNMSLLSHIITLYYSRSINLLMIIFQFPKKEMVLIKVVQSQVVEVKRSVYVQTDEIPRKALKTISRLITTFLAFSAHYNLWNVLQFLVDQITAIFSTFPPFVCSSIRTSQASHHTFRPNKPYIF